jgi:hypothetical protein
MIVPNEPLPGSEEEGKAAPAAPGAEKGREGHPGRAGAPAAEGAPDPEKAWERMKDRMAAQGVTKEQFLKRFKERMAEGGGRPGGSRPALSAMPSAASVPAGDPKALAHIPGGASQLGGPKFTGNLALRSGMTANVTISTNQRRDVLRVPNAALRFNPAAFIKDEKKTEGPRLGQPAVMGGGPRPAGAQPGTGSRGGMVARREDRIWVLENGKPKAIVVKAGISDGQFTEVSGEGLTEGLQVLVGVENSKQAGAAAAPLGGAPGGGRR